MDAFDIYRNDLINRNKKEFSAHTVINWLNPYKTKDILLKREILLNSGFPDWMFKKTKPFHGHISKGCEICGNGEWSCLFITGQCNAKCFYCPTSQENDETPGTQNFTFSTPEAYADYINHFKFKGVSFSGGEPLISFDRTLSYLKLIRQKCSADIYTWLYTNGILANSKNFQKLADAGLNEIRFDIGATGYSLEKVKLAKGIIPNVTIEIPAIPEEKQKLKKLIPDMIKAGVTNLNLHQLRLTKYNAHNLISRNYTVIPDEKPVILESEITALEILEFAKKSSIKLGINYCSFHFKNRFQKAGFRKKVALTTLTNKKETITENGFIRNLNNNSIGYETINLLETNTGNLESVLKLPNKVFCIKKQTAMQIKSIDKQQFESIKKLIEKEPDMLPSDPYLFKIWQMEYIEKGLRIY